MAKIIEYHSAWQSCWYELTQWHSSFSFFSRCVPRLCDSRRGKIHLSKPSRRKSRTEKRKHDVSTKPTTEMGMRQIHTSEICKRSEFTFCVVSGGSDRKRVCVCIWVGEQKQHGFICKRKNSNVQHNKETPKKWTQE